MSTDPLSPLPNETGYNFSDLFGGPSVFDEWLRTDYSVSGEDSYQAFNAFLFTCPDIQEAPLETRPPGPNHVSNLPTSMNSSLGQSYKTEVPEQMVWNAVYDDDSSASAQDDKPRSQSPLNGADAASDAASFCHLRDSFGDAGLCDDFEDKHRTSPLSHASSSSKRNSRKIVPLPTRALVTGRPRIHLPVDVDSYGPNDESDYTLSAQPKRKRAAVLNNTPVKAPRVSPTHTFSSGSSSSAANSSRDSSPNTSSSGGSRTRHQKASTTDIMRCCFFGCDHTFPDHNLSALSEHFSEHSYGSRAITLVRCSFDFCDHECAVNDMSRHLLGHLPPQYKCSQCGQAMARKDSRNRHLEKSCQKMKGVGAMRKLKIIKAAETEQEWRL